MKPTLLVLAAGLGSRYGGLKQIDPVGPNQEIIIDYSIYDAIRAGFGKLVFVIQHHFEDIFRKKISSRFDGSVDIVYTYQELDSYLDGFSLSQHREKPWGTGHAILVARDEINEPFAVINADDYYGTDSFQMMADFLSGADISEIHYSMIGFILRNTLSEYGTVCRGVCECNNRMFLQKIVERTQIEKTGHGARFFTSDGAEHKLTGDEIVSMNLWGFHPSIFNSLEEQFKQFLNERGNELKSEFFIPTVVDNLMKRKQVDVKVLPTHSKWFGVTYKNDKKIAGQRIRKLIDNGTYPEILWEK